MATFEEALKVRKARRGAALGVSPDEITESLAGSLNEIAAVKRWLGTELVARLTTKRLEEPQSAHLNAGRIGPGEGRALASGTVKTRLDMLRAAWRRAPRRPRSAGRRIAASSGGPGSTGRDVCSGSPLA